jgi:outer membrane protein assembly factor BamB
MIRHYTLAILLSTMLGGFLSAADWPNWRGPRGTGASDEKNLPVRWSASENIAWKAPIGGVGVSSPIVSGDLVVVTSQIGAGIRRPGSHPRLAQGASSGVAGERALAAGGGAGDRTFFVVEAFNRADGRRLWQHRVEAAGPLPGVHDKHNLASPSPVSDGQMVYAWFGTGQIVALDMNGKVVWGRHLGKERWTRKPAGKSGGADRGRGRMSYTTPFVVETPTGPELIVNSSQRVDAYDPRTGAFLWHVGGSNQFPIPAPTFHDGIVYMTRGYRSGPYMAVRPGGRGDISSSHVVWEVPTGAPYVSSLVYDEGILYMASDVGAVTAIDAATGKRIWQQRVEGIFSASPVAGDGKIYFVSETGETIVLKSGRQPEVLARNDLGERLIASPAISNGQLFIRGDGRLFAVGKR